MKFRQRMAWLMLFAYLLATLAVAYYLFEVSAYFGDLSSANVQLHRTSSGVVMPSSNALNHPVPASDGSKEQVAILHRLSKITTPLIFCICSVLYIQTFCVLYACTRPTFHCHPFLIMLPILGCIFLFRGITTHNNRTKNLLNDERRASKVLSNAVLQYELPVPVVTGLNHIRLEGS